MNDKVSDSALKVKYRENEVLAGFLLQKSTLLPEIGVVAYEFEHQATGAKLAYLDKDDANKTFGVTLQTLPNDSSGVAHILEHVVLCGSKRYPVRDPFFSMLKRSLQNFMNAFTASDWTMYPFCTVNEKDFFNLLSVYLDAVFFPRISEQSFLQEGWRLELQDNNDIASDFTVKGVVFNEMKGAMSTQEEIMVRRLQQAVFPGITYHHNSGGEPSAILDLTWQDLKDFHADYYHPSSAWFYLYGNLPLVKTLEVLNQNVLNHFTRKRAKIVVPDEKRYSAPQSFRFPYPNDSKAKDAKHQLALAWLANVNTDIDQVVIFKILTGILLSHAGSPLKKALIESKLGSSLSDGTGYESDIRETFFNVGLKGVAAKDLAAVEKLILETLAGIAKDGINPELIQAAWHEFELSVRDLEASSVPQGLLFLLKIAGSWLHGGNLPDLLDFDGQMRRIKQKLNDEGYLSDLIADALIANKHRVKIELYPDESYLKKQEQSIEGKVLLMQKASTLKKRQKIQKDALDLDMAQKTGDDISVLPKVKLSDIPIAEVNNLDAGVLKSFNLNSPKGARLDYYRAATNNIAYLQVEFAIPKLSAYEYQLLPTLGICLVGAGTAKTGYDKLATKIASYTGGISVWPEICPIFDSRGEIYHRLIISAKCLVSNFGQLTAIIEELITELFFHDQSRIEDLLKQRADRLQHKVLESGHSYAGSLAMKNLHQISMFDEYYAGIAQVKRAKELASLSGKKLADMRQNLASLGQKIFSMPAPNLVLVAPEKWQDTLVDLTGDMLSRLTFTAEQDSAHLELPDVEKIDNEICLATTPVSYAAQAFKVDGLYHENSPALSVLATLLRGEFLHREIREKGGAYGAMAGYDYEKGIFLLLSYRDPNLARTWQVFDDALQWGSQGRFSPEDLESAIIQVFSKLDKPLFIRQKALRDRFLKIKGITPEFREEYRQNLLSLSKKQIVAVAKTFRQRLKVKAAISALDIWKKESAALKEADYKLQQL